MQQLFFTVQSSLTTFTISLMNVYVVYWYILGGPNCAREDARQPMASRLAGSGSSNDVVSVYLGKRALGSSRSLAATANSAARTNAGVTGPYNYNYNYNEGI